MRQSAERHHCCPAARARAVWPRPSPDRSGRHRDSARAPASGDRSRRRGAGSVATCPSQRAVQLVGDVRRRSAPGGRRPRVDLPRHLRVPRSASDDVHEPVDASRACASSSSASSCSVFGSSPKIFTSIGVGRAFEVAEHVLQQLHELDFQCPARRPSSFGRRSAMISSAAAAALAARASAAPGCRPRSAGSRRGPAPSRCGARTPPPPACRRRSSRPCGSGGRSPRARCPAGVR